MEDSARGCRRDNGNSGFDDEAITTDTQKGFRLCISAVCCLRRNVYAARCEKLDFLEHFPGDLQCFINVLVRVRIADGSLLAGDGNVINAFIY